MALPEFGIHSSVRVCYDCFNNGSRSGKKDPQTSEDIGATAEKFSSLDVSDNVDMQRDSAASNTIIDVCECKCGMPLCICESPAPEPAPWKMHSTVNSTVQSNPRPKKAISTQHGKDSISKTASSTSNNKGSVFFNLVQGTNSSLDKQGADYEVNGEGLREAIKNSDTAAVQKLLREGVDANYCDKQGMSLLHLAALFNHTDIVFILMEHGASPECKNSQGETPIDCAPAMLQYKMRKKMEGV